MPGSASRSPPLSSGKVSPRSLVTKYFAKGVLRCPGSGYVARFTAQRDRISCTPPFISWSMVCVGVLGLPGAAALAEGAFPSALSSARALWTAPSTAMADNMIPACFIARSLTKTKEAASGFQAGIPTTNPRKRAAVDRGTAARSTEVNQRRERGGAAGGCPNNLMLYRSFRSKASHRPERGPAPNWRCACPAFTNTSGGDANSGSDGDAGSGHTRKRGAHSATRLAVWHRLPVGQSCLYSGVGLDRNSADFAPLRPNWRSRVRRGPKTN